MDEFKVKKSPTKRVKDDEVVTLSKKDLREIVSSLESQVQEAVEIIKLSNASIENKLIKKINDFMSSQPCKVHNERMEGFEKRLKDVEEFMKSQQPVKYWFFKSKLWFWSKKPKIQFVIFSITAGFLYLWFLTDIL